MLSYEKHFMSKNKCPGEIIEDVVARRLCTGCGTCAGLCPSDALAMVIDRQRGVYIPRLDKSRCDECGLCAKACPALDIDYERLNREIFNIEPQSTVLGNYMNCYTGYSLDQDVRYSSASGGLLTATLLFALEEGIIDGALLTGMSAANPLQPQPFIARTREEIISSAKSKYCPVPANIALKEILEKEGKYAAVGLPCHLHGIRKAEKINRELKDRIVLHLNILCSGTPNFNATRYLLRGLRISPDDVETLEYRGGGWPGRMSIKLKDGRTENIPYPVYWGGFGGLFFPLSCALCIDWYAKLADISFGDAWLPELKRDEIGSSIVIARSQHGEDILQRMAAGGKINLMTTNASRVNETQGGLPKKEAELKIRLNIAKLSGKKRPIRGDIPLPHPSPLAYLNYGLHSLLGFIASRRNLWGLLDIYNRLFMFGSRMKSRLTGRNSN